MKPLMNTLLFLSEILGLPIIYLLSYMSQIGSEKVDRTSMALIPGFAIWFLCIALLFYKHLYVSLTLVIFFEECLHRNWLFLPL